MKLDIAHAWKDQAYRAGLNNEQLETLPANPAGELSDADLDAVFGGWNGGGVYHSSKVYQHNESYGLICEVNVFSISALISNVAILGTVAQTCAKG